MYNNIIINNENNNNNNNFTSYSDHVAPLAALIRDSDYYKAFYGGNACVYDIIYFVTKLLHDYDCHCFKDDMIGSKIGEIKSWLSEFFRCYRPIDPVEYKDIYSYNCLLFSNAQLLRYLKLVCREDDLCRQFTNILFYQRALYSKVFLHYYNNINACFNIESHAIDLINLHYRDAAAHSNVSSLILAILCSNTSTLSKLSIPQLKNDILLFLDPRYSSLNFEEYNGFFGMFKDYIDVNEYNLNIVKASLVRFNSDEFAFRAARNDWFQMTLTFASHIYGRFFSEAELFALLTTRIDIDSRYKYICLLDNNTLLSEEFNQILIKSISFDNLESLAVVDIYQMRSLVINENLYNYILMKTPKHYLHSIFQTRVTPQYQQSVIKSLSYLYHLQNNIKFINLLFQYLCLLDSLDRQFIILVYTQYKDLFRLFFTKDNCNIFIGDISPSGKKSSSSSSSQSLKSNSNSYLYNIDYKLTDNFFVYTFKIRQEYWLKIASCLTHDNVVFILENIFAERPHISSDLVDFIMATNSPKDTINYCMTGYSRKFVLTDKTVANNNINFISLYLEELFKLKYDMIISHPNQPALKELIHLTYTHNPDFILNIQLLPLSNVIPYLNELNYIYKYFIKNINNNNNNNNYNNNNTYNEQQQQQQHINSKFNFMILKDIIKMLMLDRHVDTKWKVGLSTVSKEFYKICSTIFSTYPVPALKIRSQINIGAHYCLFKNPPLHLTVTEIQYIPDSRVQECLDNLECLTQYFYNSTQDDSFVCELIDAKNLKHISIVRNDFIHSIYMSEYFGKKISKSMRKAIKFNKCCGIIQNFDLDGNFSEKVHPSLGYNSDDSTFGQSDYFMKLIVDHYNNSNLESVRYVGGHDLKGEKASQLSTHYIHSLFILQKLKHSKPTLQINASLPDFEITDNSIVPLQHDQLLLISKFNNKHNLSPFQFDSEQQSQLLNLKSFTHSYKKQPNNKIIQILNNSPNIRKFTIVNSLREEHLHCLQYRGISTLVFKFKMDSQYQKGMSRNNITNPEISRIFEILEHPAYQSINTVKLEIHLKISSQHKVYLPMISQLQLSSNVINFRNFQPLDLNNLTIFKKKIIKIDY